MSASEDIKKDLIRFLLEQVKDKQLSKDRALGFLKSLEGADKATSKDVAVIGIACHFPEADSKEEFWTNLDSGRLSIRPFPAHRRADLSAIDNGQAELFAGGFLNNVDGFDSAYFNIAPAIARHMDPYHRLFLMALIEAIEDAGYSRQELNGKNIGVFAGNDHTHRLFNSYLDFVNEPGFNAITGSWTAIFASRLSYLLNLKGPAMVVDTSCSSGLVALDCAIKALQAGDCESALVGAANLFFAPGKGIVGDIENDDFRVRAFDEKATGTAWGEGVAALMVKTLAAAERDGDTIYGVIKGIAVNNDGASNGITAPNAKAQQDVVLKAWEKAGINPEHISYIESHGTGTNLGDPIEIKGLAGAFGRHTKRKQFCGLGSVKTNIGHTVGVAGLASLIKVLLAMKHQRLPASLNFDVPNPFIDFCSSPIFINDHSRHWAAEGKRLAGVSSFSLSGTNCHVVVQEPELSSRAIIANRVHLFPLSARNETLLQQTLQRYIQFIEREPLANLIDVCATAAIGREHHPLRIAITCDSLYQLKDQLIELLNGLAQGKSLDQLTNVANTTIAHEKTAVLDKLARDITNSDKTAFDVKALEQLSLLYAAGAMINWSALFADTGWKRAHLPAQPFLLERYWDKAAGKIAEPINNASVDSDPNGELNLKKELDLQQILSLLDKQTQLFIGIPEDVLTEVSAHKLTAYVIAETLGYEQLKWQDDFYALGGDSISAARIIHILNELCLTNISVADLLAAESLGDFSQKLVTVYGLPEKIRTVGNRVAPENKIQRIEQANTYPLSSAQKRMYLLSKITPESTAYNVNSVIAMDSLPDIDQTNVLVQALIERHEILRTGFEMAGNDPVQRVHDKVIFNTDIYDLKDCSLDDIQKQIAAVIKQFIRPFDLTKPPLLRLGFMLAPQDRYYMLIDMHHIVTDGSSMGILISDYLHLLAGKTLPQLPFQYKDFAAWHNQHVVSDDYRRQALYWRNRFADGIPVCELSADFPRPVVQQFSGQKIHQQLPAELTEKLKKLATTQSVSLFVLLMGALRVLLFKYRAGADLVIGSPVTGRNQAALHSLIGMFVNTLALRAEVKPQESFASLLKSLKKITLEDLAHQDYPYEDLVESLNIPRNPGRNPLFDIYFVLQNADMGLGGEGGLDTLEIDTGIAKFDLTIIARESRGNLAIEWEFATAIYTPATIAKMTTHFAQLLESICSNVDSKITGLDFLSPQEKQFLLHDINQTETDYPKDRGIPGLFQQQVSSRPDSIAVQHGSQQLTYAQLNDRANRLAHYLVAQGISRDEFIALYFTPSIDMVTAILAVLKTGCAYVPLDPENPVDRNKGILNDSAAALLLSVSSLSVPEDWPAQLLAIDALDLQGYTSSNPDIAVTGDDLVYAMYTSGTTGRPKGTLLRQKSIIRVVCKTNFLSLDESDVCLLLSSYAFDGCVLDLYGALLNGGRLVLIDKTDMFDLNRLGNIIQQQGITSLFATTSLFNVLVDNQLKCLTGVRQIMFGGEAASSKHINKAFAVLGPGRLINGYGPTETAVFATTLCVQQPPALHMAVAIGSPIANTYVYVLDEQLQPVPAGVVGELYIGGDGVAVGYLNQPELTAEKFITNPFVANDRLYKTGDLVKWLPDCNIQYIGRADHQLKIRGFRIELEEIREVILQASGVMECLVTTDSQQDGHKQLLAYIVVDEPECFNTDLLRQQLARQLPDYMLPGNIVVLAAFPLTNNGKIDRSKLPEPERQQIRRVAPSNAVEIALVSTWQSVLGLTDIGINENFFSLGGDSIRGIQVIAHLQNAGWHLQMAQIFQYQTIGELAPWLTPVSISTAEQGLITGALPLNPIQRWFFATQQNGLDHFNQSMFIEMESIPESAELEQALIYLCTHHDALRSRFYCDDNNWRGEIINNPHNFILSEWQEKDWQWDSESLTARLAELQTSLRIDQGVLLALGAFRSPSQQGICIAIHHLAVDVISWNVLLEDLQICLTAAIQHKTPQLKPKTHSIIEWNNALTESANKDATIANLDYWLAIAQTNIRSICANAPIGKVSDARTLSHQLSAPVSASIMGAANNAFHTEPQHLILAALTIALEIWKGPGDSLIQLERHGRDVIPMRSEALDISRTCGWFTVAFPFLLKADADFSKIIKAVKESLRSVPGKGQDYGLLTYLCEKINASERNTLQQLQPHIGFNFLGSVDTGSSPTKQVIPLGRQLTTSPHMRQHLALDLVVSLARSQLEIEALFDSTRLHEQEVNEFLLIFTNALDDIGNFCLQREVAEKTASDFTATDIKQSELDAIFEDLDIF